MLQSGDRIEEYEIVRVLGSGGFGVTYLAFDLQMDGPVALKEYFPAEVATRVDGRVAVSSGENESVFSWGLRRFLDEARTINRFRHPNVVRALRYLEARGTAYIVMEYVEGESLASVLAERGPLPPEQWRPWLDALLGGLAHVHGHDFLHRDIKPANIVLRAEDGEPVLIDFGAARVQDRTQTQVLTPEYAPIEQHSRNKSQGPWTDIYALAAVSYRVLTGEPLSSAPDRMLDDDYAPLAEGLLLDQAGRQWLAAIDHGLALRPEDRPQSIAAWREAIGSGDKAAVVSPDGDDERVPASPTAVERPTSRHVAVGSERASSRPATGRKATDSSDERLPPRRTATTSESGRAQGQSSPREPVLPPESERTTSRPAPRSKRGWWAGAAGLVLALSLVVVFANIFTERRPGGKFRDCAACPEMVVVDPGTFQMGSPEWEEERYDAEGPRRSVTIAESFALGVHEVTFDEWRACIRAGGCGGHAPDDEGWGEGRRPVINVSWEDAQSYVSWLSRETGESYRLPSESEWEYAARAGTETARFWGESSSGQCRYANGADAAALRERPSLEELLETYGWEAASCDDGYAETAPVGTYLPNAWGVHDMSGNVGEWVEDCWHESYVGAPRDGSAWSGGDCGRRVLRGGSWSSNPGFLRSAFRNGYLIGDRHIVIGFRVARTLD